jgi:acetyl-CoA C-acetyltransferase
MRERQTAESGFKPVDAICGFATAASAPEQDIEAAAKAIQKLLDRAGLAIKDINCLELTENSAADPPALLFQLGDTKGDLERRTNLLGGALAYGKTEGADGIGMLISLVKSLEKTAGRYGIAAIASAGGQGMAILIERR